MKKSVIWFFIVCTLNNFVKTKISFVFPVRRNACLPPLYFLFLSWKVELNPNNSISVMFDCAWKVSGIHGTNMTDTRNEWQNAYLVLVFELSSIFLLLSFLRPLFNGRLSAISKK